MSRPALHDRRGKGVNSTRPLPLPAGGLVLRHPGDHLSKSLRGCSQSIGCRKLGHEKEIPQRHQ